MRKSYIKSVIISSLEKLNNKHIRMLEIKPKDKHTKLFKQWKREFENLNQQIEAAKRIISDTN